MCEQCVEIDKKIDHYQRLASSSPLKNLEI